MRNRESFRSKGFTSIELLLSLVILASILVSIIHFASKELDPVKGMTVAENSVDYAKQSTVFLKTYYMAFEDALTTNGDISNGKIITIPPQILRDDGFFPKNYPDKNKLNQYPCIVVSYGDNQLEAFLYYRSDGSSKTLNSRQQIAGLEHVGGMIGLYQNGNVRGAGKTWNLTSAETRSLFIAQGTTEPNVGFDAGKFKCQGRDIANDSFVINYASIFALKNRLPKDDVLSQYPDPKALAGDVDNDNTMNNDLNMDGDDTADPNKTPHSIVFQMNQNCVMDPTNKATMQDYDSNPAHDGHDIAYQNKPNTLGCKNKQLSIKSTKDIHGDSETVVTGFKPGGDASAYDRYNYNKMSKNKIQQPFVGELKAQSFQPTTLMAVGTPCEEVEIGTMARQTVSGIANDVNNLYVSQVICMKNPLCPASTNGICFMPANSVTIKFIIPVVKNDSLDPNPNPNAISKVQCPAGMAMVEWEDDHGNSPKGPDGDCCLSVPVAGCEGWKHVNFDGYKDGPTFEYLSTTATNTNPFRSGVKLGYIRKAIWCDDQCRCGISGGFDIRIWQPQVLSITCSNDINRVPVQVYQ